MIPDINFVTHFLSKNVGYTLIYNVTVKTEKSQWLIFFRNGLYMSYSFYLLMCKHNHKLVLIQVLRSNFCLFWCKLRHTCYAFCTRSCGNTIAVVLNFWFKFPGQTGKHLSVWVWGRHVPLNNPPIDFCALLRKSR